MRRYKARDYKSEQWIEFEATDASAAWDHTFDTLGFSCDCDLELVSTQHVPEINKEIAFWCNQAVRHGRITKIGRTRVRVEYETPKGYRMGTWFRLLPSNTMAEMNGIYGAQLIDE